MPRALEPEPWFGATGSRLIISLCGCARAGRRWLGGEARDVGRRHRESLRHHGGAAAAGEHHRALGQGHRLDLLLLPRQRRQPAHRRPMGRQRQRRGHGDDHFGPFRVCEGSRLVSGPILVQERGALHHLDQVRDQRRHLWAFRTRGGQHAPQLARAQQWQRRRHVRPRRRFPRRHRLLRSPALNRSRTQPEPEQCIRTCQACVSHLIGSITSSIIILCKKNSMYFLDAPMFCSFFFVRALLVG